MVYDFYEQIQVTFKKNDHLYFLMSQIDDRVFECFKSMIDKHISEVIIDRMIPPEKTKRSVSELRKDIIPKISFTEEHYKDHGTHVKMYFEQHATLDELETICYDQNIYDTISWETDGYVKVHISGADKGKPSSQKITHDTRSRKRDNLRAILKFIDPKTCRKSFPEGKDYVQFFEDNKISFDLFEHAIRIFPDITDLIEVTNCEYEMARNKWPELSLINREEIKQKFSTSL